MKKTESGILERMMEVVNKCEGKVELIVEDKMRLNLKSTLSQFVSMIYLLEQTDFSDVRIHTSCGADSDQMMSVILGQ